MPDAFEHPWLLRAVVELVRRHRRGFVVDEFVAFPLGHAFGSGGRLTGGRAGLMPGLAAVIGALNDLAEPAAGLRGVDTVGIDGGALEVVHLPPAKERPLDVPFLTFAV